MSPNRLPVKVSTEVSGLNFGTLYMPPLDSLSPHEYLPTEYHSMSRDGLGRTSRGSCSPQGYRLPDPRPPRLPRALGAHSHRACTRTTCPLRSPPQRSSFHAAARLLGISPTTTPHIVGRRQLPPYQPSSSSSCLAAGNLTAAPHASAHALTRPESGASFPPFQTLTAPSPGVVAGRYHGCSSAESLDHLRLLLPALRSASNNSRKKGAGECLERREAGTLSAE